MTKDDLLRCVNKVSYREQPPPGFAKVMKLLSASQKFLREAWQVFRGDPTLDPDELLEKTRRHIKAKKTGEDLEEPDQYIPVSLMPPPKEDRKEVRYAAGYATPKSGFAMWAGPSASLITILNHVPEAGAFVRPVVIRFNLDGTDEIRYVWEHPTWVKVESKRGKKDEWSE